MQNTRIKRLFLSLVMSVASTSGVFFHTSSVSAEDTVPNLVNYQGRLYDTNGDLIHNPTPGELMSFEIYDVDTGGVPLWSSDGSVGTPVYPADYILVGVTKGVFNIYLGNDSLVAGYPTMSALPDSVFHDGFRYLQVYIEGEALTPRTLITPAPYAVNADYIDGRSWEDIVNYGDTNDQYFVNGSYNSETNEVTVTMSQDDDGDGFPDTYSFPLEVIMHENTYGDLVTNNNAATHTGDISFVDDTDTLYYSDGTTWVEILNEDSELSISNLEACTADGDILRWNDTSSSWECSTDLTDAEINIANNTTNITNAEGDITNILNEISEFYDGDNIYISSLEDCTADDEILQWDSVNGWQCSNLETIVENYDTYAISGSYNEDTNVVTINNNDGGSFDIDIDDNVIVENTLADLTNNFPPVTYEGDIAFVGDDLYYSNGTTWVEVGGSDNWGTQVAVTDSTITGDGTASNPLSADTDSIFNEIINNHNNWFDITNNYVTREGLEPCADTEILQFENGTELGGDPLDPNEGWVCVAPQAGPQGPQGPAGPQGPQGPQGPAGNDGADGALAGLTCANNQIAKYVSGAWTCAADNDTDTQNLSIVGHTISLQNGGSVTVPDNVNDGDYVIGNEYPVAGNDIDVSGRTVTLENDIDVNTVRHTGDADTYVNFPASNTINFATGNVERMRIASNGNVGIGTNNPSAGLDIQNYGMYAQEHTSPVARVGLVVNNQETISNDDRVKGINSIIAFQPATLTNFQQKAVEGLILRNVTAQNGNPKTWIAAGALGMQKTAWSDDVAGVHGGVNIWDAGAISQCSNIGSNGGSFDCYAGLFANGDVAITNGNLGIGTAMRGTDTAPAGGWARLNVKGDLKITGTYYCGQSFDIAETYPKASDFPDAKYGDVVMLSDEGEAKVSLMDDGPYSYKSVGVISTDPGMLLGGTEMKDSEVAVALAGRVPVCVTNEGGDIAIGDLMVTSSTPGCLMKGEPEKIGAGMLIGKAMADFSEERGEILVYVN